MVELLTPSISAAGAMAPFLADRAYDTKIVPRKLIDRIAHGVLSFDSPSRAIDDTYGPSADLATRALTFPKVVSDFLKNAAREMIDDAFLEVPPFVHHGVLRSR